MGIMNTAEGWGIGARLLHWGVAAIILFQLAVGFYMVNMIEMTADGITERTALTQTHKSWGFVVFTLALVRVAWRRINPTPAPVAMPRWQHAASEGAHIALYVLMIAIPVTGWLMASASPLNDPGGYVPQVKNMVFGLFELPDPFPEGDKALTETLAAVHAYAALGLALLLAVHAGAALKHHFVDRDRVLMRMIRGR